MAHVRILVIGDVHLCDHSPGRRVEGYKDHILAKLEECVQIAKTRDVTHVLFLGDIFHIKTPTRVSHRLVQQTAELLEKFEVPVAILIGNHDITNGTVDTINKQPLGTLRFVDNVTLVGWEPYVVDDDVVMYPVPGESGMTIENFAIDGANKRDIMIVHQSIVPDLNSEVDIEEARKEMFDASDVANVTNLNIIMYGHQHRNDGMYTRNREDGSTVTFCNLGSICRLTITEDDVYKKPQVYVLDIADDENRTVTPDIIDLVNVVPPEEAYNLEDHLEEKEKGRDIEETLRLLKNAEISVFSIEGVISEVSKRSDIDESVKSLALDLLEAVR